MSDEIDERTRVSVRTFTTSAASAEDAAPAAEDITYEIDGRNTTFHSPDLNHLVIMLARVESSPNDLAIMGTMVNVFMALLSEEDARHYTSRLFNPKDNFNAVNIAEYISALVEDMGGGRPTDPASASSRSHSGRGKTSKAKRHGHKSHRGRGPSQSGAPSSSPSSGDASQ